jgi:predicted GTPase
VTVDPELDQRAHRLLSDAALVYRDNGPAHAWLWQHINRLAEPLRLAVAGPPQVGKSTLVNALLGEDIAPVAVDGDPRPFTRYEGGPQPRARLWPSWGAAYEVPVVRANPGLHLSAGLRGDPMGDAAEAGPDVREVVVEWPCRALRRIQFVDTPGLRPDAEGAETTTRIFREADAVLYLTRHLGAADLRFLQDGQGSRGAGAFPVQVMVVLSRADENADGRLDAVLTTKQIARRRRRDPRIAMLSQDVLAVSPLIAHAARTLRDEEFDAIAALGALSRTEAEPHLLSTDRFMAADRPIPIAAEQRARLLERLGLGGIRLAATLVRTGCHSRAALGESLLQHSGLDDLQAAIADLFTGQQATLKARSALIALDQVLRREPRPQSAHLAAELELLVAGAHEFRELRLLAALRTGRVTLPAELALDARRLVGGNGPSVAERLGTGAEALPDEVWSQAYAAAARWQQELHRPEQTTGQRRVAEVVLRSCGSILAQLG